MVFHNLWKEKMAIYEKKSKKVRKSKGFFKKIVENHVDNVDKKRGIFPQKCVEKNNGAKFPILNEYMDIRGVFLDQTIRFSERIYAWILNFCLAAPF